MRSGSLGARSFLLAPEKSIEGDVSNFADLESDSRDVTNGVALSTEPRHQNLVILLHKVETAVVGDKGGDLLAVFDQLNSDALADSGVRLLGLNANLLQHDTL